jgi:hypothetical protein
MIFLLNKRRRRIQMAESESSNEKHGKKSGIKIEKVDRADMPKSEGGSEWASVLKYFNPLGHIAEAYAKTLTYKLECKRLDAEVLRIKEQSGIINKVIDNNFKLKIMELENRRAELVLTYSTINKELDKLHVERKMVLEMAQMATKRALENGIDIEERKIYQELATEMTKQLPLFGDRANETLKNLIQTLPPMNIPKLITDGVD